MLTKHTFRRKDCVKQYMYTQALDFTWGAPSRLALMSA